MSRLAVAFVATVLVGGCLGISEGDRGPDTLLDAESSHGSGAHIHDYWNGETEKVLLDEPVPLTVAHVHLFDEPPREQHMHGCDEDLGSDSQGGTVKFTLPTGSIVPPGTESFEVTASWDVAAVTGVRVMYRPPVHDQIEYDHGHDHLDDYTDAGSMKSGGTVSIPVTMNMTDLGHDFQSRWAFFLCADNDGDPALAQGDADVLITAIRMEGELPVDPPHPNHWEDGDRQPLAEVVWSGQAVTALNAEHQAWHRFIFHKEAIVPPRTSDVEVLAWLNGTGASDPVDPTQLLLYYRDSTVADWIFEKVEGTDGPEGSIRFKIPVEDNDMTDSYYAKVSHWDLWIRLVAGMNVETVGGLGTWGLPNQFEGTLEATAYALR